MKLPAARLFLVLIALALSLCSVIDLRRFQVSSKFPRGYGIALVSLGASPCEGTAPKPHPTFHSMAGMLVFM
jgi:hypothetical protein